MFIAPHIRVRRGIVNGLGSVIKAITGNLDYDDAVKIEKEISILRNSVSKIHNSEKQSLYLAKTTINEFSKQVTILNENQKKLTSLLKNATVRDNFVVNRMHFLDLYIQIDFSLQILLDKLVILEDAMTFAQLGVMHPSIIAPHNLVEELLNIQNLNEFKPIDKISIKNIHIIEKSIGVRAYSTENTLTFILDIPSIDPNLFDHIHIYSIPDKQNLTIIPKSKYLALGSEEYSYLEGDCKAITQEIQLCDTLNTQLIESSDDCVISLIKHQVANCTRARMNFKQGKIQKLQDNEWLIILNQEQILRSRCGQKMEYKRISGIHIASITSDCQIDILNRTLKTNTNTITIDEVIPLPNTRFIPEDNIHYNLQLEDIALDSIHELMDRAQDIEDDSDVDWQLLMATPSWTTIGLYVILAGIITWKIYQRRQQKRTPDVNRSEDATGSCGTRFQLREGGVKQSTDVRQPIDC